MPETLTELAALDWLEEAAGLISPDESIVELGVYRGGSLARICDGAARGHGAKVYGVDSWGSRPGIYCGRPHMLERYVPDDMVAAREAAAGRAVLLHATTIEAAATFLGPPVGLLFIDAEHRRLPVLNDFHAWRTHLAPGAVVAFDDYEPGRVGRGVMAAVSDLVAAGDLTEPTVIGNRLAVTFLR